MGGEEAGGTADIGKRNDSSSRSSTVFLKKTDGLDQHERKSRTREPVVTADKRKEREMRRDRHIRVGPAGRVQSERCQAAATKPEGELWNNVEGKKKEDGFEKLIGRSDQPCRRDPKTHQVQGAEKQSRRTSDPRE